MSHGGIRKTVLGFYMKIEINEKLRDIEEEGFEYDKELELEFELFL